jgi:hypothetical protein
MAQGYSGLGNYKTALEFTGKAFLQAPDADNKSYVKQIIGKLEEGKDFRK